jgi:hypothetical protein
MIEICNLKLSYTIFSWNLICGFFFESFGSLQFARDATVAKLGWLGASYLLSADLGL